MNFSWIVFALSLTGTILNMLQRVEGFYLWILADVYWAIIDYKKGIKSQALLQVIYLILAVIGIYCWSC